MSAPEDYAKAKRLRFKALMKKAKAEGLLIEAGWLSLELAINLDGSRIPKEIMRSAFFAGAAHLYKTIMDSLNKDDPTPNEMKNIDRIEEELREFARRLTGEVFGGGTN